VKPALRRWLQVLAGGLLLETVVVGVPWRQRVQIALTRGGVVIPHQALRLVSRPATDACASAGLEGTTNEQGLFEGTRWQWSHAIGLCDVEVRTDALCVQESGVWTAVWQLPYGPAPRALLLKCELPEQPMAAPSKRACRLPD
jgi:hypothetical protein